MKSTTGRVVAGLRAPRTIRDAGRELGEGEHWSWSKHGIYIVTGSYGGAEDDRQKRYAEDNVSLRTEQDVFAFFHLEFREPREREV